jgi:ATP-dependent DNA helicase RecQ
MLNQSKISQREIQQVWIAIKKLTKSRYEISQSALEIARKSGWDDSVHDIETRVKTAINALEKSNFVKRGQNMPRIYADGILVKNVPEAQAIMDKSERFDDISRKYAGGIISKLISAKSKMRGKDEEGEGRIDYISDGLGIPINEVIRVVGLLREEKILADTKDIIAYIKKDEKTNHSKKILSTHCHIENFLFGYLDDKEKTYNIKEINEELEKKFPETSMNQLDTILNYFSIKRLFKRTREDSKNYITLKPYFQIEKIKRKSNNRHKIAGVIIDFLYERAKNEPYSQNGEDTVVEFSVIELKKEYDNNLFGEKADTGEIEDALFYLLKIGAMKIEGGFLVIYNTMQIERLEKNNKVQYSKEDYAQ